mmetsp:Transcript_4509/g.6914  ORF Transcript_4509/g.6914 Transcript_4509/m.6914 type:complete len:213 (+) Transcript_4509:135-773(+)|eukprot:CAMPEP_0185026550 /NCGR_PEP_ID=MMETSP1103-20130426/10907_1 /TAXON_ID=36769 /ORGANISM="Paraphysomonas bandaiensis, Strain Caron Lab Isolate" /LENGTH=212 /DNA_ID=CAMNT_0027560173 /DNA_START=62 /DNA_END=700 /DNA_ORIENTATION=-
MNHLLEYEFDALPYIDKEYEHPAVQDAIHALIADEMRSFAPSKNYISHLPYPRLKFANSAVLQGEMARVANGTSLDAVDNSRYCVEKPEGPLEKDVQAWKKSVSNAKAQMEHQANRLLNLEIADSHGSAVWLQSNSAGEGVLRQVNSLTTSVKRKCDEVNLERKTEQEGIAAALERMTTKTNDTLMKAWQIKKACDDLEAQNKRLRVSQSSE